MFSKRLRFLFNTWFVSILCSCFHVSYAENNLNEGPVSELEIADSEELLSERSEVITEEAAPDEASANESRDEVVEPPPVSWRERYTLGPGDVLDIRFYGQPELARNGVRIGPDFTISYLQANSVKVANSTINELRALLEKELSKSYRNPRLIITPVELKSKRYTILGKIIDKGVFTLERPITLLEAIAQSRGIEVGLIENNTVEMADMERSFIIRHGEMLDVDFAKLYFEGDLSQNVYLEPQDYIYLASNDSNQYFVFGAVNNPGAQNISRFGGVVTAVTRRTGFADNAWRKRILVIRGSLTEPETFMVNVDKVLQGEEPDFMIGPGDIVYVSSRPWYRVEQILDQAIGTYFESAASAWTNVNVPDIIQKPYIKDINWRNNETPTP